MDLKFPSNISTQVALPHYSPSHSLYRGQVRMWVKELLRWLFLFLISVISGNDTTCHFSSFPQGFSSGEKVIFSVRECNSLLILQLYTFCWKLFLYLAPSWKSSFLTLVSPCPSDRKKKKKPDINKKIIWKWPLKRWNDWSLKTGIWDIALIFHLIIFIRILQTWKLPT